jgi:hypothetical protein
MSNSMPFSSPFGTYLCIATFSKLKGATLHLRLPLPSALPLGAEPVGDLGLAELHHTLCCTTTVTFMGSVSFAFLCLRAWGGGGEQGRATASLC